MTRFGSAARRPTAAAARYAGPPMNRSAGQHPASSLGGAMRRREFLVSAGAGALGASMGVRPAWAQAGRWEPDGVGTVARFGVLTPDFDPVPESELWAMAPRGVSIHAARMPRGGPGPRAFAEPPIADEAVDRL